MIAAASKAKTKFRVTENFNYYLPVLKAKELLDSGAGRARRHDLDSLLEAGWHARS